MNCGQCGGEFPDRDAFLAHHCPVTDCVPTDPAFMGDGHALIQQAALKRGLNDEAMDTVSEVSSIEAAQG